MGTPDIQKRDNFQGSSLVQGTDLYTLKNQSGLVCQICNYGARVTSLFVPDRDGRFDDIVLGFDCIDDYVLSEERYFGATIGRQSNRIRNACVRIEGHEYKLTRNDGENHLHGGTVGFDSVLWKLEALKSDFITLSYSSVDGEQGYPGNLRVTVSYRLTSDNILELSYEAITDAPTIANLTHHSFFNLEGQEAGSIEQHVLRTKAQSFAAIREDATVDGRLIPVHDTAFDFRKAKPIGAQIGQQEKQLLLAGGYDHHFVMDPSNSGLSLAAEVWASNSGRKLSVYTDQRGFQLYTGNFLDGTINGKAGATYGHRSAFCIECQHFPDSQTFAHFEPRLLQPTAIYLAKTSYKFSVEDAPL